MFLIHLILYFPIMLHSKFQVAGFKTNEIHVHVIILLTSHVYFYSDIYRPFTQFSCLTLQHYSILGDLQIIQITVTTNIIYVFEASGQCFIQVRVRVLSLCIYMVSYSVNTKRAQVESTCSVIVHSLTNNAPVESRSTRL